MSIQTSMETARPLDEEAVEVVADELFRHEFNMDSVPEPLARQNARVAAVQRLGAMGLGVRKGLPPIEDDGIQRATYSL